MSLYLLVFSLIIIVCVFLNKFSGKVGVPVLLFFLMLGLLFGSDYNDFAAEEGNAVSNISTIALIFIMFYGGFGTRWKSAKPVIVEAGLLATVSVAMTAAFVGMFCHWALHWEWVESFLMGAVIASTDAASVFSILRTRKLGLKNNTAPLLEVESGSNDPMSFMLTTVLLSLIGGTVSAGGVLWEVVKQIVFGAGGGLIIATCAVLFFRRIHLKGTGFDLLLFVSLALVSHALPDLVGGNGFLSAYIVGIVIGNTDFPGKKELVSVFDTITSLMQIVIFFLLGMLAIPANLLDALVPSLAIFGFLLLVARPVAVCGVLLPFGKYKMNQIGLISFAGLRGAASIVFAIMTLNYPDLLNNDIFSIVFCIVILSIALQGTLIPPLSKATGMIDEGTDVMTTFNDFKDGSDVSFGSITIDAESRWNGKLVRELDLPQGCLLTMVVRGDGHLLPKGDTVLHEGDKAILCTPSYDDVVKDDLIMHPLSKNSKWAGKKVREYPNVDHNLLVLIKRGDERIVPHGDTILQNGDVLIILLKNKLGKSQTTR